MLEPNQDRVGDKWRGATKQVIEKRQMWKRIQSRRDTMIGHILRRELSTKYNNVEGDVDRRTVRGRPMVECMTRITKDTNKKKITKIWKDWATIENEHGELGQTNLRFNNKRDCYLYWTFLRNLVISENLDYNILVRFLNT